MLTKNFAIAVAVALLTAGRVVAADNWPEFRGPDGQGHAAGDLPIHWSETQNVRWKTPIHDKGWSSPVVWGNQVWLTTATAEGKKLYAMCVDLASGKIVYDIKLFDIENPANTQQYNSFASPTPAIEKDRVYISFGSYGTACLDTRTGKTLWHRQDLPCNHFRGPGSSPVLFENLVLLHFDGFDYQFAIALDKTGDTVWKADRAHDYGTDDGDMKKAFATPLVIEAAGRLQMISPCAKAVFSYDPRSGKEIWRVRYPSHSAAARPLFAEGLVFIDTGFSKADLLAIRPDGEGDVTKSNIVWKATKGIGSKPSPVLVDGLIYVVTDGGVATCLDAKTGKEVWTQRLGGEFSAALLAARDRIYFCDEQGKTTVIKAGREYQELASNKLDDGGKASPAAVGRALIMRTKSALYRIEER